MLMVIIIISIIIVTVVYNSGSFGDAIEITISSHVHKGTV